MECVLGFKDNGGERVLSRDNLYNKVLAIREKTREDLRKYTGHFEGPYIVINVPIDRPFEIRDVECKGWYKGEGSGSVLQRACSNCKYSVR